jgi:hypothetical protein
MAEYEFVLLNELNIIDLCLLYKDAFNEDRTIEEIEGKFNASILGCFDKYTFIAYDSNKSPAGLYAIFPFYTKYKGESILIGQVGDILIHSKHRKQHDLFFKLASHSHEYAKSRGVKFIFSFVFGLKGSYPILTRYFDFMDTNTYKGYNIKINTFPLSKWSKKYRIFNFLYKPYQRIITSIMFNEHEGFTKLEEEMNYGEIIKDNSFISYKKGYSRIQVLSTQNVRFLLKINKDGSLGVGDVDKLSLLEIKKGIKHLKVICFLLGIRIMQFEMTEGHVLDEALKHFGQFNQNRRLLLLKFDPSINLQDFKFTYSELDTF